jgi:5-methylcytosine-specific restriction protein A
MPERSYRPCKHAGCPEITRDRTGYCDTHRAEYEQKQKESNRRYEENRSGANKLERSYRWRKYSIWFLKQPGNELCKLHLDKGCAIVSQCVDHIEAPESADDPKFWDKRNHQAACIHCNSVKGHRKIKGTYDMEDFDTQMERVNRPQG